MTMQLAFHGMAGHVIRRLHQRSVQVFTARARDAGVDLTPVQFAAMEAPAATPGLDQAGLSAEIAYDKATIGGVVDRLVAKGLVLRDISKTDRRARVLTLSKAGQEVLARFRPIVAGFQAEILSGLSPEERESLVALGVKALGDPPP